MPELSIAGLIEQNKETYEVLIVLLILILIGWNIYLQYGLREIKKKSRIFFSGKAGKDIEDLLHKHIEKTNEVSDEMKKLIEDNGKTKENLSKCIQKVGVVRFNPFGEVGGNQSFAIAILDNFASGVIILSLYSREGVRIYAKPIKEGKSEYQLSKEEEEAIKLAVKG